MKIEEHDASKHRGLADSDNLFVVHKGSESILLSKGQSYELCYELLTRLHENEY